MRRTEVTIPELGLIAGTRGILGAGLGLLLADRLSEGPRKAAGWALFLVGAISTIPLAFEVFGRHRPRVANELHEARRRNERHANGRSRRVLTRE
jgi:hypothetical protein